MNEPIQSLRREMEGANVDSTMLQLVELVQKEVETFQALLDSMEIEQRALVTQDVPEIEKAIELQRDLAINAGALERARTKLVGEISRELGETASDLTLMRLISRIEGPHSQRLGEMRETLLSMHEKIQTANKQNSLLIKQSMKYVDKSLQILTGDGPATGVYAQTGKVSKSGRTVLNQVV
jgi:flagellar biosynthesis/type III secretory pathway chaperone